MTPLSNAVAPTDDVAVNAGFARRVTFDAPRDQVFDAIATVEGLRNW